jgi:hypothetical protein
MTISIFKKSLKREINGIYTESEDVCRIITPGDKFFKSSQIKGLVESLEPRYSKFEFI